MAFALTMLMWVLRLAGLTSAADKLFAILHPDHSAADAQKAVANEDHRELSVAAAPDKPVDDILARMSAGED